jgi:DNA-binding NarL/FixJ family response regulator
VLTVLACVRTPDAARAIAVCADRLGVSASVRTATTSVEAIARLAERGADLVFIDGPLTRPDPVGFVRRAMAYSPRSTLVVYGLPEPSVASALIQAGARGVIRGGDTDLVTAVTKTVLLLGMTTTPGQMLPAAAAAAGGAATPATGVTTSPEHHGEKRPEGAVAAVRPTFTTRVNVTGRGGDRMPNGLDARNGGPAFTPSRAAAPEPEPALAYANGMAPQLVPAQRMDLAVPPVRAPNLTERELQVLRGMADGKSNAEIGRDLFVSEDTVKTHARRLFRKLGARDRAHAVASGFRAGLVG